MRLKTFFAPVFAALAIGALFATPASAEEASRLTICTGGTPTSAPTHCTSVMIPSDELHEVSLRIERCWEPRLSELPDDPALQIAAAEECIAAWGPNGTQAPPSRRLKKKRGKKHSPRAKIAVAPGARR